MDQHDTMLSFYYATCQWAMILRARVEFMPPNRAAPGLYDSR